MPTAPITRPRPDNRAAAPRRARDVDRTALLAGWAAVAGTLPYLTLKVAWLAGAQVGVRDPAALADPSITVLNAVTLGMDLVVIVLAMALTHRWGRRLPAWLVLLPIWVGVGFLAPMVLGVVPGLLLQLAGPPSTSPLQPWVQPMVYGGFAWQGVFLGTAFVLYARRRWGAAVEVAAAPARALVPLLRVLAGGGIAMAALSALLRLADGFSGGGFARAGSLAVQAVMAGFAVAGALGVRGLVGTTARRWAATAAAFAGSAAMFSWGLWSAVTTMAGTALGGAAPLAGTAALTGLLGGFALAVAGMLALVGTGVARPGR